MHVIVSPSEKTIPALAMAVAKFRPETLPGAGSVAPTAMTRGVSHTGAVGIPADLVKKQARNDSRKGHPSPEARGTMDIVIVGV